MARSIENFRRKAKYAPRYASIKLPVIEDKDEDIKFTAKPIKNRGGLDDLIQYVGSNTGREIYQARHLMNKPLFDEWQRGLGAKRPEKEWTGFTHDGDGDKIDEFYVKNKKGQTIAINGFTTKASDYPVETEYYTNYPTEAEREKVSMKDFLKDKYKEYMKIDPKTGLPAYEFYDWRRNTMKYSKYNDRIPQGTPRNVFMETFVWSINRDVLDELTATVIKMNMKNFNQLSEKIQKEKMREIRSGLSYKTTKAYGRDWLIDFGSQLYYTYIQEPILARLAATAIDDRGTTALNAYWHKYGQTKAAQKNGEAGFVSYVCSKAEVKKMIYDKAAKILNHETPKFKEIFDVATQYIKDSIYTANEVVKKAGSKRSSSKPRPHSPATPALEFSQPEAADDE